MNLDEAQRLALSVIQKDFDLTELNDSVQIIDEKTVRTPRGWIFFYNSRKFLLNNDFDSMLMGNLPVFVDSISCTASYIKVTTTIQSALDELMNMR